MDAPGCPADAGSVGATTPTSHAAALHDGCGRPGTPTHSHDERRTQFFPTRKMKLPLRARPGTAVSVMRRLSFLAHSPRSGVTISLTPKRSYRPPALSRSSSELALQADGSTWRQAPYLRPSPAPASDSGFHPRPRIVHIATTPASTWCRWTWTMDLAPTAQAAAHTTVAADRGRTHRQRQAAALLTCSRSAPLNLVLIISTSVFISALFSGLCILPRSVTNLTTWSDHS